MSNANLPSWFPLAFPIFFVAMWVVALNVSAALGGWRALAESYGTNDWVDGRRFFFRSAKLGFINYNSCLIFTSSHSSLRMAVLFPFRPGHPPLVFPWHDITATAHRGWILPYVDLRLAKQPHIRLRLFRPHAEALIAENGGAVRITEGI